MAADAPSDRPTPRANGGGTAVPRTHAAVLRGIPEVLPRFMVRWEPVLESAGLTRADLDDDERSVPFLAVDRAVGECVRLTKCAHVGLLLAEHVDLRCFGIAGRLARNAPSVGVALRELSAHFALHDTGGMASVARHDGTANLAYGVHVPGLRHADQIYDFSAVVMTNILRQLCGRDWQPNVVLLPRKRPVDVRAYREVFGVPLRFDAAQAGLLFDENCLSWPVVDADPLLHSLLEGHVTAALTVHDPLLHNDVRGAIRSLLLNRHVSRAGVARQLGLHPRTLGRRLQESGTTFQALLDETRLELARQLLHGTRSSIARISTSLGYHDPTVFTRAFRRWTGTTPRQFRERHAEAD